jgi:hypothetical protein
MRKAKGLLVVGIDLPDAASGGALADALGAALDFTRMKAALSAADESLLGVLRNPDAILPGGANALLALTQPIYATYAASADPAPVKRKALLAAILPDLKSQRRAEQALATVTATAGTDPSFAAVLLRDSNVLAASANAETPALDDFTACGVSSSSGVPRSAFLSGKGHAQRFDFLSAKATTES